MCEYLANAVCGAKVIDDTAVVLLQVALIVKSLAVFPALEKPDEKFIALNLLV